MFSLALVVVLSIFVCEQGPDVRAGIWIRAGKIPAPRKVDRYGDPLPVGAVGRIGTTRFRHGSWLQSLAYSADGKRISSTTYRREGAVWDADTGRNLGFRGDRSTTPWHSVLSAEGVNHAKGFRDLRED